MRISLFMTLTIFYLWVVPANCKAQDVLPWRDDSLYNLLKAKPKVADLQSMTVRDALRKYPKTLKIQDIDVTGDLGAGQSILYSVFPEYVVEEGKKRENFKPEFVKEITWSLDKTFNITVWYKKDSVASKPVLNRIWYKGTMF